MLKYLRDKKRKKVLVSGIQPSGQLHIGNYFGAIQQMVELVNSDKYESYIFLADYHSLTSLTDKQERQKNTLEALATYLACGLDKRKVSLFKQSDVPAVTELAWILNTVTPIPMLFLAHAFKDKVKESGDEKIDLNKLKNINVGLFTYPVLMASDILIYGGEIIPVGQDQKQHIEYAREIAKKYNLTYRTETFKLPQEFIKESVAIVPGLDGTKMSKSKHNQIPIFATEEVLRKKVMSIETDSLEPQESKNPDTNNIYKLHKLFLTSTEDKKLREKFINSDQVPYGYKQAKEEFLATLLNYFKERQEKYNYYTKTEKGKKEVLSILNSGAKQARIQAAITLKQVRSETGLDF